MRTHLRSRELYDKVFGLDFYSVKTRCLFLPPDGYFFAFSEESGALVFDFDSTHSQMCLDKIPEKLGSKWFLGPEMLYDWFFIYYAIEFDVGAFGDFVVLLRFYYIIFVFSQNFRRIIQVIIPLYHSANIY